VYNLEREIETSNPKVIVYSVDLEEYSKDKQHFVKQMAIVRDQQFPANELQHAAAMSLPI